MKKENVNSFIEEDGIRILESFLESKKMIKTHFLRNDKTPIYDGFFNLLNNKHEILKQFDVQIKSSENLSFLKKGNNKGKIKFEFDVDVLDSVRFKITENPTFYFIVDPTKKIIVQKLLSKDFLVNLNYAKNNKKKVTYYFENDDILNDYDNFYSHLLEIVEISKTTICFKSQEEIATIQKAMSNFYNKFEQLSFIKDKLFPNLWKFGIKTSVQKTTLQNVTKNSTIDGKCNTFAIFPIFYGSEAKEITDYFPSSSDMFTHLDFTNSFTAEKYLTNYLSKIVNCYFNGSACIEILPNDCLIEIIFATLDKVSTFINENGQYICIRNEQTVETINSILSPYFSTAFRIINEEKSFDIKSIHVKYFVSCVVNNRMIRFNEKKIEQMLLCYLSILELQKRNFKQISRIWDYLVSKEQMQFIHYRSEMLDSKKLSSAINVFFSKLSFLIEESLNLIPCKIKNNICGSYIYQIEYSKIPYPERSIKIALVNKKSPLLFEEREIDFNKEQYLSMSWSAWVDAVFEDGMPFYIVCRELLLEMVCNQFGLESKGITVNYETIKFHI